MHPLVADVTPEQARLLVNDPGMCQKWMASRHIPDHATFTRVWADLMDLSFEADDAEAASFLDARHTAANLRRRDVEQIVAWVERADRLPDRLEDVYRLCIQRGLSLNQAAAELGISRNSVRTHLRRLRALVHRPPPDLARLLDEL
jgi:DNA-directed RNA polymerase specialized sigma24 family protein